MAEWRYKAKDSRGKFREGILSGNTRQEIVKQLRDQRLRPVVIAKNVDGFLKDILIKDDKGNYILQLGGGIPSTRDLAVFTKQCSIMIERGLPLIQTLGLLGDQQKSFTFKRAIKHIRELVENGSSFSNALERYPRIFDELYVSMIRAGEVSGSLDTVMREIVKFLEKSAKLRAQFKAQYSNAGKELPFMTQIVVGISDGLINYFPIAAGILGAIFFAFYQYKATPQGQINVDKFMINAPLIGPVMRRIAVGRFCATMATMLQSGVSILDALTICAQASGNKLVEVFVLSIKESIARGSTFADPLGKGDLFPRMVVSMVAVGEQTGALDQTLAKVAEIYEEEVDTAVKNMMDSLQPILIVGIGVILGFILISLYLPVFDAANLAS